MEIACWTLALLCAVQACSRGDGGVGGRGEDGPGPAAPLSRDGAGGGTTSGEGGHCGDTCDWVDDDGVRHLVECPCGQICVLFTVFPDESSGTGGMDPNLPHTRKDAECYSSPPHCEHDSDCRAGQTCEEGWCSCSVTQDCGTGPFVCAGGMCSAIRCASNLDCAEGFVCTVSGTCGEPLAMEGDPELSCAYRAAAGSAPAGALAALALAAAIRRRGRRDQKV